MAGPYIHVVGCGGIGSYLVRELSQLFRENQLVAGDGRKFSVKLYDADEIEQKNLPYQDFTVDDLFRDKCEVLGTRYSMEYQLCLVDNFSELVATDQDIIVCCVDNAKTRKLLFSEDLDVRWVDLRSHGRYVAMFVKSAKNDRDYLLSTLPEKEEAGTGSCQIKAELDAGIIQLGNRIIASIGAQTILNMIRGVPFVSRFTHEF